MMAENGYEDKTEWRAFFSLSLGRRHVTLPRRRTPMACKTPKKTAKPAPKKGK
jgi:hypothetical protein